jgi:hypothetical protein
MLFQFPDVLPFETRIVDGSNPNEPTAPTWDAFNLFESVPEGKLGQLQIHQSGKMTLSMGDTLFEVHSGTQPRNVQQVVVMDPITRQQIHLGDLERKFLCTPNIDVLLNGS